MTLAGSTTWAVVMCIPAVAWADAEEASAHGHAIAGAARIGDPRANDTQSTPMLGAGARFSYATSDWFAYEAAVAVMQTGRVRFTDAMHEMSPADIQRATRLTQLSVGVTARFGTRFVPTLGVAVGAQWRHSLSGIAIGDTTGLALGTSAATHRFEALVQVNAGFDYRWGRHLITGIRVAGEHALSSVTYTAAHAAAHVSYYWYPRWF